MKEKLYISGPMDGILDHNRAEFERAQKFYEEMGFEVINPHQVSDSLKQVFLDDHKPEPTYCEKLSMDLQYLTECNRIVVLSGYKKSFGAGIEIAFAEKAGIPIYHAFTDTPAELHVHMVVVTAYDKLVNAGRIEQVLEDAK